MKIAFLGKGGSGKSTLATEAVRHAVSAGKNVLAIDADHNMDLAFNLGVDTPSISIGSDPGLIKEYIGVSRDQTFQDARRHGEAVGTRFTLSPMDPFTSSMTTRIHDTLSVMVAGPHTDEVRFGQSCSHSLSAPLKAFLPLLTLSENDTVVIDERAGTDPVATGILSSVDRAIIVAEPTVHSVRVASQIARELDIAGLPYDFVANKVSEDVMPFEALPRKPIAYIAFSQPQSLADVLPRITTRP